MKLPPSFLVCVNVASVILDSRPVGKQFSRQQNKLSTITLPARSFNPHQAGSCNTEKFGKRCHNSEPDNASLTCLNNTPRSSSFTDKWRTEFVNLTASENFNIQRLSGCHSARVDDVGCHALPCPLSLNSTMRPSAMYCCILLLSRSTLT